MVGYVLFPLCKTLNFSTARNFSFPRDFSETSRQELSKLFEQDQWQRFMGTPSFSSLVSASFQGF